MDDRLTALLAKIKQLEHEVVAEMRGKEKEFGYKIHARKVRFDEAVAAQHRKLASKTARYLQEARIFSLLTAPVIWSCIFPALFLDLVLTVYQFLCFPVYGIPKVRRIDYIVMDRRRLAYLNPMEKFNCYYCEYVNGLLAYAQEIAGRTEQYWCPIKHALGMKITHSRYSRFLDYGDAEHYRRRIEEVRRDFEDLTAGNRGSATGPAPAPLPDPATPGRAPKSDERETRD